MRNSSEDTAPFVRKHGIVIGGLGVSCDTAPSRQSYATMHCMRKQSKTSGSKRRLGNGQLPNERLSDYARSGYAQPEGYQGADAFGATRYRNRTDDGYVETAPQRENSPTPSTSDTYSVAGSRARYSAMGKRRRRRHRIVGAIAALAVVATHIAGSALGFFGNINAMLHSGLDSSLWSVLSKVNAGEPFYMLLLGTDESADRQDDEELAGVFRSDTIILTRVDPKKQTLTMVSIPRDTKVDLGEYGEQKINAAHAFGGATLAVQAVEDLTGLPISHYAEINFDGFIGLVDALGGVEVDVPMAIDDEDAGGHVDAGLQTLDSWQALTLCRARNAYEEVVGSGDLYRAANQRLVLGAIVKKVLSSDPATMANAINSCAQYVRTDLDVNAVLDLANQFRGFDSEQHLYTAVYPVVSEYTDDIWWDIAQEEEWEAMRARMEEGKAPLTEDVVDPTTGTILATAGDSAHGTVGDADAGTHSGRVIVRNGSPYDGAAAKAAKSLEQMGFKTDVDNADAFDYPETLVVYKDTTQSSEAQQIVDVLNCGNAVHNDGTYAFEGDFLVVIGADWS